METKLSVENLQNLIHASKDDRELLHFITDCLKSFEAYHLAIFEMEAWAKVYNYGVLEREEYRDKLTTMDRARSACHNAMLSKISMLNRMAERAGVGLIYEGTVSEDMPFRRQLADVVLAFVEDMVSNRR